jgi:hypothetical protein
MLGRIGRGPGQVRYPDFIWGAAGFGLDRLEDAIAIAIGGQGRGYVVMVIKAPNGDGSHHSVQARRTVAYNLY